MLFYFHFQQILKNVYCLSSFMVNLYIYIKCKKVLTDGNNMEHTLYIFIWQMCFHPEKCIVIGVPGKRQFHQTSYTLHGHTLNQKIGKASKTIGFLRRNLGRCTTKTKATAYTTLVRPVLEYASPVWDPHQITTTRDIEQVQRRAARFAYNCYQDNSSGCVTNLLNSLQWESLQQRRWKQTLVMCYKIHHQLIAIEPANYYTAGDSRTRGNHRLGQIRAKKDTYM